MSRGNRWALAALTAFAVFYALLAWNGALPYVFLTGDAANNASIAAAMDHPDWFQGDALLDNPEYFRFYRIVHLPLLRLLQPLAGDYGTANHLLLPPHLLVHLFGFYFLGRLLLGMRTANGSLWSAFLALMLLAPIHVNMDTFWGVHRDSLARCTFQALLPWLLCMAWAWRAKPGRWPLVMIAAGLLMFVHAVSAPTWGFALWLGFALCLPPAWPLWRKAGWMLVQGAAFLAAAAPIALNYLGSHEHGADMPAWPSLYRLWPGLERAQAALWDHKFQAVRQAWLDRFHNQSGVLHLGDALTGFFTPAMLLLVGAGLGAAWLLRRWSARDTRMPVAQQGPGITANARQATRLILGWLAGVLCVTVGLTGLEQLWAALTETVPVEMNLVRGLRFVIPLMLICVVWALAALHERLKQGRDLGSGWVERHRAVLARVLVAVAVLALCGAWYEELRKRSEDQRAGYVFTLPPAKRDLVAALDFLRSETPVSAVVLPVGQERDWLLPVRYYGCRAVPYAWKDGGVVGYADNDAMLEWYAKYQRERAIEALEDPAARAAGWAAFARDLGADYVFRIYEEDEARVPLPGAVAAFTSPSVVVYGLLPGS